MMAHLTYMKTGHVMGRYFNKNSSS